MKAWCLGLVLCLALGVAGCSGGNEESPTRPSAIGPLWFQNGAGNFVFDKPASITRLRIAGNFSGAASNFIVWCGSNLLVNELLGSSFGRLRYEGVHAADGCTQVRVEMSNGVSWTFTEVR